MTWNRTIALSATLGFLLGGVASGEEKPVRPPVFLNHFYVVLDGPTYKAVEQSPFLRQQFAPTEKRTTVRTDRSYTGFYFYGTNTYFEFFDGSDPGSAAFAGDGLAFGVDQAGGLRALGDEIFIGPQPITRLYEGKQVPWFYMAGFKDLPESSGLDIWLMEYHPDFLVDWNPRPGSRGVTRKEILHRYAAVLRDVPAKPLLEDVTALTIAVDEPLRQKLAGILEALGYSARQDGGATILKGPDAELRLIPQTATARGIQEITLRVRERPKEMNELRFGTKSVLKFHDNGLATWSF
ncbi:MAG TPA: DUF5829 family protein [Thermoanaerobaculia bacterium]|nr:DUF5829 family protein [Thermoanaerobaculia bacterium]